MTVAFEQNGTISEAQREANRMRSERRAREQARSFHVAYGPFGQYVEESRLGVQANVGTSFGYGSAASIRESGRTLASRGVTSDYHARDLDALRAESQRLDRDNCIYQAMQTRIADVILGEFGPSLQPGSASREWNTAALALWNSWWFERPEIRRMDDGPAVLRKVLRHYSVDGDHLINRVEDRGLIQLIIADQIHAFSTRAMANGNRIKFGVEVDQDNAPVRFHVCPITDYDGIARNAPVQIEAAHCTYLANRRRIDQTRGEPIMQSAFAMLHRINDVCDSEAAAWQLLSRIALTINEDDQRQVGFNASVSDPQTSEASEAAVRVQDFGSALVFHGSKGSKISGVDRNIPGSNFVESLKMFMRLMGMATGFSLEFILLIWSDTNYSSGRASIKQVERNCRPYRAIIEYALCEIYRWKIGQWIAVGALPPIRDSNKCTWHFPPYPFLDPQKEAAARSEAVRAGQITPQQAALEDGTTLEVRIAEISAAMDAIATQVEAHNAKHPGQTISIADFVPRGGEATAAEIPQPAPPADVASATAESPVIPIGGEQ